MIGISREFYIPFRNSSFIPFTNSVTLVLTMPKKAFQESWPIWFMLPRASDSAIRSTMYAKSLFIISFCTPDRWGYVAETGMEIEYQTRNME